MKRWALFLPVLLAVIISPYSVLGQSEAGEQFDTLVSLVGKWQGKTKGGEKVTVTYEFVSNKSALFERLMIAGEPDMITMYHRDGDHLMLTHYCSVGNQPRMRAESSKENSNMIRFSFIDATNLASSFAGHMRKVIFTMHDADHLTQEWTWRENYQEKTSQFELERIK